MKRPLFTDLTSKSYFKEEDGSYILHDGKDISTKSKIGIKTSPSQEFSCPIPVKEGKYITYIPGGNSFQLCFSDGTPEKEIELDTDIQKLEVNYSVTYCLFTTKGSFPGKT